MNKNKLYTISGLILLAAGAVLLCLSIFGDSSRSTNLALALLFITAGNLLNVVRLRKYKKNNKR